MPPLPARNGERKRVTTTTGASATGMLASVTRRSIHRFSPSRPLLIATTMSARRASTRAGAKKRKLTDYMPVMPSSSRASSGAASLSTTATLSGRAMAGPPTRRLKVEPSSLDGSEVGGGITIASPPPAGKSTTSPPSAPEKLHPHPHPHPHPPPHPPRASAPGWTDGHLSCT